MLNVIVRTDFEFPGQKSVYHGKVRDVYNINDDLMVMVVTDRISAFDVVLPKGIPYKGQVLNQTAAFWFEKTKHIVKNHVIEVPDPNVLIAKECKLIPIEMVVRGYLTGTTKTSVLYNYERGVRDYCGNKLPEGMTRNQKFSKPIITPTTKAEMGHHDELISGAEAVEKGIVTKELWNRMAKAAIDLYNFGNEHVGKNNLILVDTKYEFGLLNDELILIDEVHTPDSSRFWLKDKYEQTFRKGEEPHKLDKEYVRKFLADRGFLGDAPIPNIPDEVKVEASKRYITAYEMITGKQFEAKNENPTERIGKNLRKYF